MNISDASIEAAAKILYPYEYPNFTEAERAFALSQTRAALEAATPSMLSEVWRDAYYQGVEDERTSQDLAGIAGCFCTSTYCTCVIAPARANPYERAA